MMQILVCSGSPCGKKESGTRPEHPKAKTFSTVGDFVGGTNLPSVFGESLDGRGAVLLDELLSKLQRNRFQGRRKISHSRRYD
jgi:hypothetical protein